MTKKKEPEKEAEQQAGAPEGSVWTAEHTRLYAMHADPNRNDLKVKPPDPPTQPSPGNPSLSNINPSSAKQNAGTVTFNANGTRFYEGSKISFAGAFIPTAFVNTGQLTGTIKAADYVVGTFLVHVDNEGSLSINKNFSITSPSDLKDDDEVEAVDANDPDELEAEIEEAEDDGEVTKAKPKKRR